MTSTLIVATAGTIFQRHDPAQGRMVIAVSVTELLEQVTLPGDLPEHIDVINLNVRSGAELTFETACQVQDIVVSNIGKYSGFVLVTGTDTMDEFAFTLFVRLHLLLVEHQAALVLTGSMKPADILGYDGPSNLKDSIMVSRCAACSTFGVMVVMNGDIHWARHVFKSDSQAIGAFRSHPGCLGQIRSGRPVIYVQPAHTDIPCDRFRKLSAVQVSSQRVCIITTGMDVYFPEHVLSQLDGLVIAAPGTGSLSLSLIELLSPKWTQTIPVVICTRCTTGNNSDDDYYKGSIVKYESRGFLLSDFEHLNPWQARVLLMHKLAAGDYSHFK